MTVLRKVYESVSDEILRYDTISGVIRITDPDEDKAEKYKRNPETSSEKYR